MRNETGNEKAYVDTTERFTPTRVRAIRARPCPALPLKVIEDANTGQRFVVYTTREGEQINLRFDGAEPWFSLQQTARIFGTDLLIVNQHVRKFLEDCELPEEAIRKFEVVHHEDGQSVKSEIEHCSLDAAFYIGYRVNPREGKLLRQWAADMLAQLGARGFVVDARPMEDPGEGPDRFEALLEKIRNIRSSEKRMWTRVLELASFCSDYEQAADAERREFFSAVQNAMHWAVTQQTAAEVIYKRVDAAKPNAGVIHFAGNAPTVREAQTAKNFYTEAEIKTLNLVTSLVLEFFESQAEQRRTVTLAQFLAKMRALLELDGRPVLLEDHESAIDMEDARKRASDEFRTRNARLRAERRASAAAKLTRKRRAG